MHIYNVIFARLRPIADVEIRPYRSASIVGFYTGVADFILATICVSMMLRIFSKEMLGQSAAASLSNLRPLELLFLGVFLIPFIETFTAQLLPLELAKKIGFKDSGCIGFGAALFGMGHYLNGGLGHGVCAAVGGALFSTAYLAMRPWGCFPALWASYCAHALNNFLVLYMLPFFFPNFG